MPRPGARRRLQLAVPLCPVPETACLCATGVPVEAWSVTRPRPSPRAPLSCSHLTCVASWLGSVALQVDVREAELDRWHGQGPEVTSEWVRAALTCSDERAGSCCIVDGSTVESDACLRTLVRMAAMSGCRRSSAASSRTLCAEHLLLKGTLGGRRRRRWSSPPCSWSRENPQLGFLYVPAAAEAQRLGRLLESP